MDDNKSVITFKDVKLSESSAGYELSHINIDVLIGERLFIYGGDDSLRTLFLMGILGIITPEEGEILVNRKKIPYSNEHELLKYRRNIGYATTQNGLLKGLTVKENIMLPMQFKGVFSDSQIDEKFVKLMNLFNIQTSPKREAWGLEKVEEKKILLARAVASEPQILLIDDPTSFIELKDRDIIRRLIDEVIPMYFIDMQKCTVAITTEEENWGVNTGDTVFMLR